jgi:peptidoglycan/xylan/chitin deacetylase (PgdA/CDA1 family)
MPGGIEQTVHTDAADLTEQGGQAEAMGLTRLSGQTGTTGSAELTPRTDAAEPPEQSVQLGIPGTDAGTVEAERSEPEPAPHSRYLHPPYPAGKQAAPDPSPVPGKVAYLTFDDGPSIQTEPILAILREYGIKATFFVNGHDTEEAKSLYRQIDKEGHRLGNHTYSHDYAKIYQSEDAFMEDVRRLERLLEETVGHSTDILRFPGGSNTRLGRKKGQTWIMPRLVKRVEEEGFQYFDWNVSSTDAAQAVQPKSDIVSSVLSLAKDRKKIIVLMHDVNVKTTTVEALPEVICGLKEQGFRFDTLDKQAFTTQFLK